VKCGAVRELSLCETFVAVISSSVDAFKRNRTSQITTRMVEIPEGMNWKRRDDTEEDLKRTNVQMDSQNNTHSLTLT